MIDTSKHTQRCEQSLNDLAATFTDLILLVEAVDKQVDRHAQELVAHADRLAYQDQQIAELRRQLGAR